MTEDVDKPIKGADVDSETVFLQDDQARFRGGFSHVESIEAPEDLTIVIKMKQPYGPFINAFEAGSMPIVPKHIYEGTDYATNEMNSTPIGPGPYKFVEWEKGSYIHLTKNEDYYIDGLPHIDDLYYRDLPDAASRAVAFETGEVQVLPGGSVENWDVARLTEMDNVCSTSDGWEFFAPHSWMLLNNREGPTSNKLFRQAVMFEIDPEFVKALVWHGSGSVPTCQREGNRTLPR